MNGCPIGPPIDPVQALAWYVQAQQALFNLQTGQMPTRIKTENYETQFAAPDPVQLREYIATLRAAACGQAIRGAIGVIF